MVDAASIKTRFPEFTAVDDSRIDLFIADAVLVLNEAYWGTKYDLGISYLVGHYLTFSQKTDAGFSTNVSPLSAKSVDGVSLSYATPSSIDGPDAYYNATAYGQRYLALRKTLGVAATSI